MRSPAPPESRPAPTGPRPCAAARSQGARHAAPPPAPLGLRFRALLGLGFAPPPEPRPCAHCASIAYTLLPAARVPLCCHRADPESSSRSLPSGSPARIAPPSHPPRRRAPPSASPSRVASAPGPWLARIAPHASLFRRMREKGPLPGNFRPKCMLFEIKMATSSPYASISGRNRAIQDTWRANLAAKGPLSRRGARNHAWREDVASAARPFRGSGMRHGRMGFAPCGSGMRHAAWPNGLCALRRGPGLLAACAPPCHLACAPAARVHRHRLARVALRRPHRAHRAPPFAASPIAVGVSADRALPAALVLPTPTHRAHRCALAGTAWAPTRANRAPTRANRTPAPRQPGLVHPWSRLRPPAPRHPPRLTLPRGFRCGSGNSREMVR